MSAIKAKHGGGRPRKFHEASRPVTVTLPERTLERLAALDKDRARAIARATDLATGVCDTPSSRVEIVEIEPGTGIIVVGPSRCLRRISWLKMIEIAPGRFLLSIPTGTAVESLEVGILDLLDHLPPEEEDERDMLVKLRDQFRNSRRGEAMSKAEILFVKTRGRLAQRESTRHHGSNRFSDRL
jgi:hypothetical protein